MLNRRGSRKEHWGTPGVIVVLSLVTESFSLSVFKGPFLRKLTFGPIPDLSDIEASGLLVRLKSKFSYRPDL